MNKFTIMSIALLCSALTQSACDAEAEPIGAELCAVRPRLLEGPPEVVVGVESPQFVGKMLSCFGDLSQESSTIIEYRDGEPFDAVQVQQVEVCFATNTHVAVGDCLRNAMIEAGGQVLP